MPLQPFRHVKATAQVLAFRLRAIEAFDDTAQTARTTLLLLFAIVPLTAWLAYIQLGRYLPRVEVSAGAFWAAALVQAFAASGLSLALSWLLCRLQGLQSRFALLVTSQLWLRLFCVVAVVALNRATAGVMFSLDELKAIGLVIYLVQLGYAWLFCWLALRCNPFYAAGMVMLMFALEGSTSDALSLYVFGTSRPVFLFEGAP